MDSIVPEFTVDELASIVSKAVESLEDGISVRDYSVKKISTATLDGFLAEFYALRITVDCSNLDPVHITQKLSFLVKANPQRTTCCLVEHSDTFRKEMALFGEVIPRIQKEVGERRFSPKVFLMRDQELMVMEDLQVKGYSASNGNDGLLDGFQLRKAMDALARLHAGSIIVEETEGKSLKELFPGVLDETVWVECGESIRKNNVDHIIGLWCEILRRTEKNPTRLNRILNDLPKLMRRIYGFVKASSQFQNVLCHGDLWSGNLLFRSLAGIAEDCILANFLKSRYAPPAYDLNLLISLATTRNFRRQHFEDLIGYYFTTLRKILDSHGIAISKGAFMESCNYYRLAGLIHSCLIGPEVLLPQRFRQQVSSPTPKPKVLICLKAFLTDVPYRTRLLDMIDELIDTEILYQ